MTPMSDPRCQANTANASIKNKTRHKWSPTALCDSYKDALGHNSNNFSACLPAPNKRYTLG